MIFHSDHGEFLRGIHQQKWIELTFLNSEGIRKTRKVIPLDYGIFNNHPTERYHFLNISPNRHPMGIEPSKIFIMKVLDESFDPKAVVYWKNIHWIIPRNWNV